MVQIDEVTHSGKKSMYVSGKIRSCSQRIKGQRFKQIVNRQIRQKARQLWTRNHPTGAPDSLGVCLGKTSSFLVVLMCMGAFTFFIYRFFALYLQYPTVVDVSVQFPDLPNLPAITICNKNILKQSKLCNGNLRLCDEMNNFPNWTVILYRTMASMDIERIRTLSMDADFPNCSVINSTKERSVDLCKNATWIYYNRKTCYVMNWMWSSIPFEGIAPDDNELNFVLDLHPEEYIPSNRTPSADIYIHSREGMPDEKSSYFTARGGSTYEVRIMTTTVLSMPPPYITQCKNYSLRTLNDSTTYIGQAACLMHCKKEMALRLCQCIPGCLLIENFRQDKKCVTSLKEQRVCCRKIRDEKESCERQCPIRCTATYYDFLVEEDHTFSFVNEESDDNYTSSDTAIVDKNRYVELKLNLVVVRNTVYTHNAKYDPIEILGYVGGYLGIWLGVSIPILYKNVLATIAFVHRVYFKYRRQLFTPQRRNTWPIFLKRKKILCANHRPGQISQVLVDESRASTAPETNILTITESIENS